MLRKNNLLRLHQGNESFGSLGGLPSLKSFCKRALQTGKAVKPRGVLLVGVPGLAKTLLVKTISDVLHLSFKRVQFTPDLMPSDITGTNIFDPRDQRFSFRPGPVFGEFVLGDLAPEGRYRFEGALVVTGLWLSHKARQHVLPQGRLRVL